MGDQARAQVRGRNWLLYCVPTGASILQKQVWEGPGEPCTEHCVSCKGKEGVGAGSEAGQDLQELEKTDR